MEPANIRDVIQRLGRRGLVSTEPAPEDARMIAVSLTRRGRALVEKLLPLDIACTAQTLAPLDARERRLLRELLGRLADA